VQKEFVLEPYKVKSHYKQLSCCMLKYRELFCKTLAHERMFPRAVILNADSIVIEGTT
jgi:hypothetical protein